MSGLGTDPLAAKQDEPVSTRLGFHDMNPWERNARKSDLIIECRILRDEVDRRKDWISPADANELLREAHRNIERQQRIIEAARELTYRPHVLQVRRDGWGLEHTILCRSEHAHLGDCPYNAAAEKLNGPPGPDGRYFVALNTDGEIVLDEAAAEDPAGRIVEALRALDTEDPSS